MNKEHASISAVAHDVDHNVYRVYLRALGLDRLDEPKPPTENDLRNRGVLAEVGGEFHPTLYGLMAFGKDPQAYPQTASFWVECVAYEGTDRASEVLITAEGKGRLDEQVNRAVGWARGLGKLERYEGLVRDDTSLVPVKALREAVVNAVAHRDYAITGSQVLLEVFADRVDITSPGTLPNNLTVDRVCTGGNPRTRNELMANYLLVMGLMERRGRGWPVIRRAMNEFNGTDGELREEKDGKYVRVTLRLGDRGR